MNPDIDPAWAWAEFVPDDQTPWNLRSAAHLLRRTGFGATREAVEAAAACTPRAVVGQLMEMTEPPEFLKSMKSLADAAVASGNVRQLSAWWTYRMLSTPVQFQEKMTLFWHGHFATGADKVTDPGLMLSQNELLRSLCLGEFSRLVLEISKNPAMLVYLDSATNRKAHPNENYAREIMELFCLGEGQYGESDIRELARCFTGWEIRRGEFRFNKYQHDNGGKTILGQTGDFDGEDGVQIVLEQQSAPEFICGKLIRFFVMDEPLPNKALVVPLAAIMRESGMQIRPVLRRILTSNLFYSGFAVGRKIRSPVELAIGLLRSLEGSTNAFDLAEAMQTLGQGLLYPPSVKGWDGGRSWINSSTVLGRSNLIRNLVLNEKTRFGKETLQQYLSIQKLTTAREIVDHLEVLLFAVPIPEAARERIESLIKPGTSGALAEGLHALCTLPEFQLL